MFLSKLRWKSLQKKLTRFVETRRNNPVSDVEIKKEVALHHEIAKFCRAHLFDKKFPYAEIYLLESYRAAAALGDVNALYVLGELLFKKARFWDTLSQGVYGCKAHQKYARDLYEEAFTYLLEAEKQNHPLAKRLHGLATIHGWGIAAEKNKGFEMIVESIELENAWDRATKIFDELGLNKPEFFSAIMSLKQKK